MAYTTNTPRNHKVQQLPSSIHRAIMFTLFSHFRLHEVVSLHTCVLPWKYRGILKMLPPLPELCVICGIRPSTLPPCSIKHPPSSGNSCPVIMLNQTPWKWAWTPIILTPCPHDPTTGSWKWAWTPTAPTRTTTRHQACVT